MLDNGLPDGAREQVIPTDGEPIDERTAKGLLAVGHVTGRSSCPVREAYRSSASILVRLAPGGAPTPSDALAIVLPAMVGEDYARAFSLQHVQLSAVRRIFS